MNNRVAATLLLFAAWVLAPGVGASAAEPPRAGSVEILESSKIEPGMKGTAWTVFKGSEPEAIPVE
ncbi:MAG: hypothetical protein GY953_25480, partial [bacterium]|nr:hypothetical protein [bacterium]